MSTSSHSTDLQDEIALPKEDIAVIKNCIEVAQDILTTVTKILDLGSPPDHKFLPNITIYSLCLVASFILAIREKKSISEAMPVQQKESLSSVCKDLLKLLASIPYPDASEVIHSKLNESSWLHQRVSSPDNILINEMAPTHASEEVDSHFTMRALDQMAAVPMSTSRALSHIDIEHLEKLSRKSSKTPLSSGFPLSKYNNTSGKKRSNDSAQSNDSYAPAKKRQMVSTIQQQQQLLLQQRQQQQQFQQFQQQQQQQQLQQLQLQQQMTTPTPTTRRLRSSTTSEGTVMQKQNGIDEEHSRNGNVNLLDGLAPESTDPFTYNMWMLGNPVFYHATEQQTLRDGRPTDVFSPLPSMTENSTVTNGTKLQLPQPSKQQAMQHKNWPSAQRSYSNLFIESELQTLHSQTPPMVNLESSYVNSIDLGVMSDTANVGTSIDPTSFLVANNQATQSEQNIIMYSDNVAPRTAGSFSSQQSNQSSESTSQSNGMVLPVSSWASSPMEQLKQTRANTPDAIWTTNVSFSSQQNSDYTSIQLTRLDRPTMFDGQSNNWIHSEKLSDDLTWN
jgi:hypothetical protein